MSIEVPDDLNEAGKAAFTYVVEVLGDDKSKTLVGHIARYARAAQVADAYYSAWLADGSQVLTLGGSTGKIPVNNPLLSAYLEAEKTAARFLAELGIIENKSVGGRPKGSKTTKAPAKVTRKEG